MTCPHCGASVQSGDLFCMSCGNALNPADPTRHLGHAAGSAYGANTIVEPVAYPAYDQPLYGAGDQASYGATTGAPYQSPPQSPYGQPGQPTYGQPGQPTYGAPQPVDTRSQERRWASGASIPAPNPYGGAPNTVSPGTMVNGRPVGQGNGGGLLKGVGAAIIALLVILKGFGHALLGIGLFKFFIYWSLFRWLFSGGHGWGALVALVILMLIVGSIWRTRAA